MTTDARADRLRHFVAFVRDHLRGDEKGEAQVFLDRLFQAFGQPGAIEAGAVYEERLKRPNRRGVSFADLVWDDVLLVEMKKRGEQLTRHTQQMLDYWVQLAGRRPAYCVLCNFDEFLIYDFNKDILGPVDRVTLDELPERFGALAFQFPTGETPSSATTTKPSHVKRPTTSRSFSIASTNAAPNGPRPSASRSRCSSPCSPRTSTCSNATRWRTCSTSARAPRPPTT